MFGQSVRNKLKAFDVYQKLPSNLTEPTMSGAIVSIASMVIIVILLISEFKTYITPKELSDMNVNQRKESDDTIRLNLDIVFPFAPCDVLSFDGADLSGTKSIALDGDLLKFRIDPSGKKLETIKQVGRNAVGDTMDLERASKAYMSKEGCQFTGHVIIPNLPGTFVISPQIYNHFIHSFMSQNNLSSLDVSHKINYLNFGNPTSITHIKQNFKKGILSILDGTDRGTKNVERDDANTSYNYYLSLVSTEFQELGGQIYQAYQYTSNHLDLRGGHQPAGVHFRYDISPVLSRFYKEKQNIFHFIVQVCAIVGGVFTITGIIDSLIHKSVVHILKKAQMNQLS